MRARCHVGYQQAKADAFRHLLQLVQGRRHKLADVLSPVAW